ncbi:MAG: hypothetical protein DMG32_16310 [Acidobacteria bacterium]|nr:MAG: hypothetical protein DMG32_16310 [Acidobacteriota bacterium]
MSANSPNLDPTALCSTLHRIGRYRRTIFHLSERPLAEERIERHRATRQPFVATIVVIDVESEKRITGHTSELSLFGCYVETATPFAHGARGRLIIAHKAQKFTTFGKVAYTVANEGMGIVFTLMESHDQAILEEWMDQLRTR